MMGDDSSGYADRFSMKFNDINENELADEAIEKALEVKILKDCEPGKYEVISFCHMLLRMFYFSFPI